MRARVLLLLLFAVLVVELARANANLDAMFHNKELLAALEKHGLSLNKVAWEDTGRDKDSCLGPNISDLTLHVPSGLAPVIRTPNFEDITVDLPIENIKLVVGNEEEDGIARKRAIPLSRYLENIAEYTGNHRLGSMLLPRDKVLLASGQACILPLSDGSVPFHVSLFNYQSIPNEPAVLVILASAYGTSAQVVERGHTPLYLNDKGKAYEFVAKRLKDDRAARGVPIDGPMTQEERERNVLYLISIPLVVKSRTISMTVQYTNIYGMPAVAYTSYSMAANAVGNIGAAVHAQGMPASQQSLRGFDHAVLDRGEYKGTFEGTRGLRLERDARFPIRVTAQRYGVTDDPDNIPMDVVDDIAEWLAKFYSYGLHFGSLVTGGEEQQMRPTAHNATILDQPPAFTKLFSTDRMK